MTHQRAGPGRIAQHPLVRRRTAQPAAGKVRAGAVRAVAPASHELLMVELRRLAADLAQARLAALRHAAARLCDLHVSAPRQIAYGIRKLQVVYLLDELVDIAAFAAAEAVPQLRGRVHLARGRLFLMERAAAPVIPSALLQRHPLGEHVHQIVRLADALDVFRAETGHAALISQSARGLQMSAARHS